MIGFGNGSNDFTRLMAKKTPISVTDESDYMRAESSSSTNIEQLSRLSVHLMEETKYASIATAVSNIDSEKRQVTFEEAFAFAQLHGAIYAEVSALTNLNLQVVFKEHM